jgi:hypothetical protein
MPVSAAAWRIANDCHLTTSYQADAGSSPFRPPKPLVVAVVVIRPSRFGAIPIEVSCWMSRR